MDLHSTLCVVILGAFSFSFLVQHECSKLDGYKFPVYSTTFCPRNETEWNERSSALNCTESNGYSCLPNENFTKLLEFCYTQPIIWIPDGLCLYLVKSVSLVHGYDCSRFRYGCNHSSYLSKRSFENPACTSIGNGCFLAEQSCESVSNKAQPPATLKNMETEILFIEKNDLIWKTTLFVVYILFCILFCLLFYFRLKRRFPRCRKIYDVERNMTSFIKERQGSTYVEPLLEEFIFNQWQQDNAYFIPTKTCTEVEQSIKTKDMVIVTGKSGTGKSAIVQHIALKYRNQGWVVKPVKTVEEIVNVMLPLEGYQHKLFFVFNDPLGKQSIDIILYNSWKNNLETLASLFKKVGRVKLIMSCRTSTFSDNIETGIFGEKLNVINIKLHECNLSNEEKQQIFNKYTSDSVDVNLSKEEFDEVVKKDEYFPLLCKLYTSNDSFQKRGRTFFEEPVKVIEKEIKKYNKTNKQAYCGLFLLVIFNNDIRVKNFVKNDIFKTEFEHALKLCGLKRKTTPYMIEKSLKSLSGFFVKKIDTSYQFYHDFVMEITAVVFGKIFPTEIIKYADTGFIRRRIKLHISNKDPFAIYINDMHIDNLGQRIFSEIIGEHLLDAVLNPCLRNEKVIKAIEKKLIDNPEKLHLFLEKKTVKSKTQYLQRKFTSRNCHLSKLSFVGLENDVSPLFALIALCHTDLARYCLEFLQEWQIDYKRYSLFSSVCCNGSIEILELYFQDCAGESLAKKWGNIYPIHIVSMFHNVDLLQKLIGFDYVDVNLKTDDDYEWTPIMLAAGNDNRENNENEELSNKRRDNTVQLLLNKGANINLCNKNGYSPLFLACFDGYNTTVEILLNNGADINSNTEDGTSPLCAACFQGHDNIVQFLLERGASVNSCKRDGVGPLFIACQNGHKSTAKLLLSYGADKNLSNEKGTSPLIIACHHGHDSIVHLLINEGADINLVAEDGTSPLCSACFNGNDTTIQLLLNRKVNINSRDNSGAGPLYIACQNGQDSTVQLLLKNGAEINSCTKYGASPFFIASQNGHYSTVQLLLSKEADFNLCKKNGTGPLLIACQNGHRNIAELLINNGVDINICRKDGTSPLIKACQKGHYDIVKLLLTNGADVNLCFDNENNSFLQNKKTSTIFRKKGGLSPLYVAFFERHNTIVKLLQEFRADESLIYGCGGCPDVEWNDTDNCTVKVLLRKDNITNNINDPDSFFSLFVFHQVERRLRIL